MNKFMPVFAGLLAAIGSYALTARAGVKHSVPVSITIGATETTVRGQLGSARNSSNNTERIECGLSSSIFASCEARDATGFTRACIAVIPGGERIIDVIKTMSGDAIVEWDQDNTPLGSSHCNYIEVYHGSNLAPKVL